MTGGTRETLDAMPDEATTLDAGLRDISNSFITDLESLLALEERKRSMAVDDPAFLDLSRTIEDAARVLLTKAGEQTSAATEVHDVAVERRARAAPSRTCRRTPRRRSMAMADADRQLAQAAPGSADRIRLSARCDALRRAYQRAYSARADPGAGQPNAPSAGGVSSGALVSARG